MQSKAASSVVFSRLCIHIEAQKLYQCKQFGALLTSLEHSVSGEINFANTQPMRMLWRRTAAALGQKVPDLFKKNTTPPKQECFWSRKTILEQNLDPASRGGKAPCSWKDSWFWGKVAAEGKCLKWISCHSRWMTRKIALGWLTADSPSFLLLDLLTSTFIRASYVTSWPHTVLQVAHWVFIIDSLTNKHSNCLLVLTQMKNSLVGFRIIIFVHLKHVWSLYVD